MTGRERDPVDAASDYETLARVLPLGSAGYPPLDALNRLRDRERVLAARVAELEAALRFYAEKAEAMHRYMTAKPSRVEAMTAVATELSLDNGQRARAALGAEEATDA